MDIKLKGKDRTKFIIFLVLFLCLALGIGFGLYYLTDVVFNGSVLDWLAEHYYYMETRHDKATGETSYYYLPIWPKLKLLLLTLFLLQLVVFVLSIYLAAHIYAKRQVQKSISNTGRMLHTYIMTWTPMTFFLLPMRRLQPRLSRSSPPCNGMNRP